MAGAAIFRSIISNDPQVRSLTMREDHPWLASLSDEARLVVLASRPHCAPAIRDPLAHLVSGALNWSAVVDLALQHGTAAIVNATLRALCSAETPADVLERLESIALVNACRTALFSDALVDVTARLEACGIRSLALKGPVLVQQAYAGRPLRRFNDLDLYVRPDDAAAAMGALGAPPASGSEQAARIRFTADTVLWPLGPDVPIELHWRFQPAFFSLPVAMNHVWERTVEVDLAGGRVRTPGPVDTMVVLAVHGAAHAWERLLWVCDVSAAASRLGHADWEALLIEAERLGLRRIVGLALALAEGLMGAPLPPEVSRWVRQVPQVERLGQDVVDAMFGENKPRLSGWARLAFSVRTRDTAWLRLRYLSGRLLTPSGRDLDMARLPRPLHWLYYALRPLRLLTTCGPRGT